MRAFCFVAHRRRGKLHAAYKLPVFVTRYAQAAVPVPGKSGNKRKPALKKWSPAAPCRERQGIFARRACKPDSVEDGHSSRRRITARAPATYPKVSVHPARKPCGSPRWRTGPARRTVFRAAPFFPSYLVLLRVGFTLPPNVTAGAVRSYRTFSPLPAHLADAQAVSSLWHWPSGSLYAAIPDVIRHTALRSPDFPPPRRFYPSRQRPSNSLAVSILPPQAARPRKI